MVAYDNLQRKRWRVPLSLNLGGNRYEPLKASNRAEKLYAVTQLGLIPTHLVNIPY